MSLKVEGLSCPVCHAYLFDEDDIVFCPVCGAPHHRDCYNAIGHCALEADHGTEREYSREKQQRLVEEKQREEQEKKQAEETKQAQREENEILCPYCRELYPANAPRCPKCGNMNMVASRGYAMPDPLGGTPADMDIGDKVTAKEAASYVLSNSHRYIPKFARIKMGNKVSFNWAAFLFPEGWFLYRKMYTVGIVMLVLTVIFSLCSMPFVTEFNILMDASGVTAAQFFEYYAEMAKQALNVSLPSTILAGVSAVLQIVMHIICGLFADAIYRKSVINGVKEMKEEKAATGEERSRRGNVNPLLFFAGLMVSSYVPSILYIIATSLF